MIEINEFVKERISIEEFIEEMESHWVNRLGNVSSEPLKWVWKNLFACFTYYENAHLFAPQQWTVAQPPTGTGKTQSTIVYCSMLAKKYSKEENPGVLIVTRLKDDANVIAEQINNLSEKNWALAYHSDVKNKIRLEDLQDYPFVVVTHRAYELALDYLGQEGTIRQTWPYFHNWQNGSRELVVIDEALDIVEHSKAGLEGLRQTLAAIPQTIRQQFPIEIQAIESVIDLLNAMETQSKISKVSEHMVLDKLIEKEKIPDFSALREAMRKEVNYDHQILKSDSQEKRRLSQIHDNRIKSLHTIFKSWVYYAHCDFQPSLNTARLLVPEGVKGAVVLDATASSNVLYELFDDVLVTNPPSDARSYKKVTLHVSTGNKVGKRFMKNNAKELSRKLIGELNNQLGKDRKVFVCCHKDVEPILTSHETEFEMMTGHWNSIDGSNKWQDCDTAVIFGLPYRPDTWTANVFMAFKGPQSTEWLQKKEQRQWKKYQDIRKALKHGQIITNIVQAINRVRCRRVIDSEGNCPDTDVFILLPHDKIAKDILDGIKKNMPGIKVKKWQFEGARKKVKRSNHELAFIKYIQNMQIGKQAIGTVKQLLGIPQTSFERLIKMTKDETSQLYKAMKEAGTSYISNGAGRGNRAFILKEWAQR
jgi:hypothetical protein